MSELKTNLQSILQEKNTKIIPQNIKKDVEVLGITGSYDKEDIKELQDELADAEQELADVRRDLDNSTATISGSGENVTLNGTAEARFKKPPLPMGNSEQVQYSGKNILATNDYGNYTINNDGTYINAQSRLSSTYIPLESTKTDLVFSCNNVAFFFGIAFYDESKNYLSRVYANNLRYIHGSIPQSAEYARAFFSVADGSIVLDGSSFSEYELQLEYGTTPTSYEPYVGGTASPNPDYPQEITNVTGDVEVVVGNKNLALNDNPQNPDANYSSSGGGTSAIQYSTQDSGYYTTNHRRRSFGILKAGSYTLSIKAKKRDGNSGFVILTEIKGYAESIMFKSSLTNNYTKYTYTFTILENKEFAVIFYNSLYWKDIQLEEGSTATTYVPHKEQTFTFPLGNEKLMLGDYLADDGIHHVRGQYVFTGSENIQKYAQSTYAFGIYANINTKHSAAVDSVLCNKLQHTNLDTIWRNRENTNNNLISSFTTGFCIMMNNYTDVNDLKEYLTQQYQNETPVTVEYPLNEEVIVPYTSAQQTVYNAIKKAMSYDKQTTVSGTSSGASPRFDIIALRNMNDTLNTLENEIELLP